MDKVNNFPKVSQNAFNNLVLFHSCIEINYARLNSSSLEHEISNTQTMNSIEAKFPLIQQTEWTKYLEEQPLERRNNSFPELLKWLEKEGNVWAAMEAKGLTANSKSSKPSTTL